MPMSSHEAQIKGQIFACPFCQKMYALTPLTKSGKNNEASCYYVKPSKCTLFSFLSFHLHSKLNGSHTHTHTYTNENHTHIKKDSAVVVVR